jgi:cytochrome P450
MFKQFMISKILKRTNKYGEIYKVNLMGQVMVCINGEENIKQVLVDQDLPKHSKMYKSIAYPFSERFLGRGLVTELDKDVWKKKRALFNSAFHRQ